LYCRAVSAASFLLYASTRIIVGVKLEQVGTKKRRLEHLGRFTKKEEMGKGKLERFSIIEKTHLSQPYRNANAGEETNALSKDRLVDWIKNDNDLEAFVVGAVVEVSGTVQKCVKRDGQCKLVIEPGECSRLRRFCRLSRRIGNSKKQ
jgi:hypothetical protein